MKNYNKKGIAYLMAVSAIMSACKPTDWSKVKYEVVPSPLEMHGDSVALTVKVTIPEKIYKAKSAVMVMPAIKWNGGEKPLKPFSFAGEKVKEPGNAVKVNTAKGTTYTYQDKVAYQPEMKNAELSGKATITQKKKTKEVELPKLAEGTIVTPLLVMNDDRTIMGKDQMPKVVPMASAESDIHFVVNQSTVRPTETKSDDVKTIWDFIKGSRVEEVKDKKGTVTTPGKENYALKGMEISAYASPDGELSLNANLAQDRATNTSKYFMGEFKKNKMAGGDAEGFYKVSSTAEDWDGFKKLMESSNVPDKDMILRILTMYSDLEKREQEIKNISKAYTEIADEILPKLRRAKFIVRAEKLAKTDDVLKQMATTQVDSLTVEEGLYAANLYASDMPAQMAIYAGVAKRYPEDWRAYNNMGFLLLKQGKMDEAKGMFEKADKANPNNPAIQNNLAVVARLKGDRAAAQKYLAAASSTPEGTYNMGIINILLGKYSEAVSNFGSENTFNAALAKLLSGSFDAAIATIDASPDKESAMGYYLKAIIGARKNDASYMSTNLKNAVGKDASLKMKAREDKEFHKFKDNADFKAIVG